MDSIFNSISIFHITYFHIESDVKQRRGKIGIVRLQNTDVLNGHVDIWFCLLDREI